MKVPELRKVADDLGQKKDYQADRKGSRKDAQG